MQKTINSQCRLSGKGLFSGEDVQVVFRPGKPDTGVVFVRTDLTEPVRIPADTAHIADRNRRTALKNGPASIETPEHCLAAISALEIDNIVIEIYGSELRLNLAIQKTECKAKEACGLPSEKTMVAETSCCTPDSGCC